MRLGMFDPPERVRWAQTPYRVNQSPEHDRLARRAAQASLVLLKNDGVLPLSRNVGTIAVIGPTADEIMSLLGNYYGTPAAPVTVLQGIRAAVGPKTKVLYSRGTDLVEGREEPRAAPRHRVRVSAAGSGRIGAGTEGRVLPRPRLPRRAGAHAHRSARGVPLGSRRRRRTISSRRASFPRTARLRQRRFLRALDRAAAAAGHRQLRDHGRRERRLPPVHRRQAASSRAGS